ncbi:hypothetical protein GWI33_010864, partial [Rhynchophorus ferrugineus]
MSRVVLRVRNPWNTTRGGENGENVKIKKIPRRGRKICRPADPSSPSRVSRPPPRPVSVTVWKIAISARRGSKIIPREQSFCAENFSSMECPEIRFVHAWAMAGTVGGRRAA